MVQSTIDDIHNGLQLLDGGADPYSSTGGASSVGHARSYSDDFSDVEGVLGSLIRTVMPYSALTDVVSDSNSIGDFFKKLWLSSGFAGEKGREYLDYLDQTYGPYGFEWLHGKSDEEIRSAIGDNFVADVVSGNGIIKNSKGTSASGSQSGGVSDLATMVANLKQAFLDSTTRANNAAIEAARIANKHADAAAQSQRDWLERMSNTSYQRAVADMEKAGLNKILAYSNGGASVPSAAAAATSMASTFKDSGASESAAAIVSIIQFVMQLLNLG